MKTLKTLSLVLSLIILFASCAKKGDTGPSGTNGTNGTTGKNGNANVKSSIFTVTNWSSNSNYYYVNITDNNVTQAILDSGAVVVYWTPNAGTNWAELTYYVYSTTGPGYYLEFNHFLNQITVYWVYAGGGLNATPTSLYPTIKFKVVCIAASAMKKHPDTNWHNYSEVQKVLNLD